MSIAAYGSKEGILGENYPEDTFSEFLGFTAPRQVVKLDTKWGKVFIYSVKCDDTSELSGDFKPEDFVKKINEIISDISEIKTEVEFIDYLEFHLNPKSTERTKKLYSGKEIKTVPLTKEGIVILSELIAKHKDLKVLLSNYTVDNEICAPKFSPETGKEKINVDEIDKILNGTNKLQNLVNYLNSKLYSPVQDPYLATSILDILNYPVTNVLPWGNIYPSSDNFIKAIIIPQLEKEFKTMTGGAESEAGTPPDLPSGSGARKTPPTPSSGTGTTSYGFLIYNLQILARASNRHLGNENFRAQPKRLTNGFIKPYEIIDNRTIATDVQVNAKQILEQLHNNIKNVSAQSIELLNQNGEKISLVIKNDSIPTPLFLTNGMPQMGGGSAVLNLGHAQAIRSFFELKRKVLRGKGKDFSDNTWDSLMNIVDDMQQKENLLVTYSHSLKNAEFDSAGNVRDIASFNNTLKKKEALVLQLAGSYVKINSIADVMMNGNLEQ